MPLKHADLIKAAVDGAVIQWYRPNDCWIDIVTSDTAIHSMLSLPEYEYRIKPADVVWYRAIYGDRKIETRCWTELTLASGERHLDIIGIERITMSPEGKLVSMEIVPESEWKA